MLKIVGLR